MGNLYRTDILQAAGVTEAPATYEDYAAAARQVKDSTGSYISNLATHDPAQVIGLLWQAGVKTFAYDGDQTVSINVNSPEAKEVMRGLPTVRAASLRTTPIVNSQAHTD